MMRNGPDKSLTMYGIRKIIITISFLIAVPATAQDTNNNYNGAREVISRLHQSLLNVMQNSKELGYTGRFDRLYPVIAEIFDTPLIVKVILSRYWKEMDELQQKNFIDLFRHLSVATYASRFDSFDGEQFTERSLQELKKGRLLIKTELTRPNDSPVNLDYLMHEEDGRWYIISVIADGVNDLSLKRAEYGAVIRDRGFDGLVEEIRVKIHDMENEIDE